jgi:hypothetical protein
MKSPARDGDSAVELELVAPDRRDMVVSLGVGTDTAALGDVRSA